MAVEQVLYNITGTRNLETANIDDLSNVVNEHPYFAPAQLLLALKQKQQGSYSYNYQLQKTSLYFSNPLWLKYQLTDEKVADFLIEKAENPISNQPKPIQNTVVEEPVAPTIFHAVNEHSTHAVLHRNFEELPADENLDATLLSPEEITASLASLEDEDEEIPDTYPTSPTLPSPVFLTPAGTEEIDYTAYALSNNLHRKAVEDTFITPSNDTDTLITIVEVAPPASIASSNSNAFDDEEMNPILSRSVTSFEIPTLEAVKQMLEGKKPATYSPVATPDFQIKEQAVENNIAAAIEEAPVVTTVAVEELQEEKTPEAIPSYNFNGFSKEVNDEANDIVAQQEETLQKEYAEDEIDNYTSDKHINNISSVLSSQMADFKKPLDEDAKLDFEKETYYTIDYFASQGIKVDLTKQPQDKLTVQLRRFTDWLKQVKGVNPNPNDLGTDPELEKAIANIAKTSITSREIVTETMADVFIKQGKIDKAIQLYIKLSFLDPHKSAYFADRIQQLKGI